MLMAAPPRTGDPPSSLSHPLPGLTLSLPPPRQSQAPVCSVQWAPSPHLTSCSVGRASEWRTILQRILHDSPCPTASEETDSPREQTLHSPLSHPRCSARFLFCSRSLCGQGGLPTAHPGSSLALLQDPAMFPVMPCLFRHRLPLLSLSPVRVVLSGGASGGEHP
jgi:hypothetical protein